MDWILDHLKLVLAIAAAIAYWLNSQRREGADEPDDGANARESEAAERTRRIQEEIRRKIAERRSGQATARPPVPPPPLVRPVANPVMPPFGGSPAPGRPMRRLPQVWEERGPTRTEMAAETTTPTAAVLERQERLAEEMRALEEARLAAKKRAAELAAVEAVKVAQEQASARSLVGDLRDAQNLRRAVIWREVLGPPVALRR